MATINVIVRTADKARKAELEIDDAQTGADIIKAATDNWSLPADVEYTLANVSATPARIIAPGSSLAAAGVTTGVMLEVQPVVLGG